MSALGKIGAGALATAAVAWFLHGPMGLGARCAGADASMASAAADAEAAATGASAATAAGVTAAETPATAQAVAACQDNVTRVASSGTINFSTGGAVITPDSAQLLDALAAAAEACAGTAIEVAGHTDAQGSAESNAALSQRRAEAVVAALTERGVPAARLTAKGYGETQLKDPNGPENNPVNRRIEFEVAALEAAPAN